MTTDKAIDLLDNLLGVIEDNHGSDYDKAIHMAIDALKGQQWIPCSERLPKKGEVVLITNEKGNVKHGQYRGYYPSDKVDWWWWKKNTTETVIAWMPLPEPYKGGESE